MESGVAVEVALGVVGAALARVSGVAVGAGLGIAVGVATGAGDGPGLSGSEAGAWFSVGSRTAPPALTRPSP